MRKQAKTPEGALLGAVLDFLAAKHVLAFRMQSGAAVSEYKGKTRLIKYGTPGMADVLAFPRAETLRSFPFKGGMLDVGLSEMLPTWIECKAENGKQSELQKSFQAQVESHGHQYCIIRSVEELEALLK